ncbi:hypothetical protein RGUI_0702 [Rhodovulum sp. P5]|nr:hypothetical protein RGUI_0702 [Rhodovulum sp. P5]
MQELSPGRTGSRGFRRGGRVMMHNPVSRRIQTSCTCRRACP